MTWLNEDGTVLIPVTMGPKKSLIDDRTVPVIPTYLIVLTQIQLVNMRTGPRVMGKCVSVVPRLFFNSHIHAMVHTVINVG